MVQLATRAVWAAACLLAAAVEAAALARGAGEAKHAEAAVGHGAHGQQKNSGSFVHQLFQALTLMRSPGGRTWTEDNERCARAVNGTLQGLNDEYLHDNVPSVLLNACEHVNVYEDFGGQEWACKPVFADLAAEFKGERNYAAWCQQATALVNVPSLATAPATEPSAKSAKIAEAKREMEEIEKKKERGEDIHAELDHLKHKVEEAEEASREVKVEHAAAQPDTAAKQAVDEDDEDDDDDDEAPSDSAVQPAAVASAGQKQQGQQQAQAAAAKGQQGQQRAQAATAQKAEGAEEDLKVGQSRWGAKEESATAGQGKEGGQETAAARRGAQGGPPGDCGGQPFGCVEPFGREHRARNLTDGSIAESNEMVDQIERAQGAEEKRATYRALTHLRGMMTNTYDSVANTHIANIDEYNAKNTWRARHPVKHLAEEEADVERWAYPQR